MYAVIGWMDGVINVFMIMKGGGKKGKKNVYIVRYLFKVYDGLNDWAWGGEVAHCMYVMTGMREE
jgi:hypothetical protein